MKNQTVDEIALGGGERRISRDGLAISGQAFQALHEPMRLLWRKGIGNPGANRSQRHGGEFAAGLQGDFVHPAGGDGIHGQVITVEIVPMDGRKTFPGLDPGGDLRRING